MINIDYLTLAYFSNGKSVPYKLKKGGEIHIKPILLKDSFLYEDAKQILEIDKNSIEDIEIIQMSYLQFIAYLMRTKENEIIQSRLVTIFELCLGENKICFEEDNGKTVIVILDEDNKIKHIISSKEFEDISKIILNQNDANYDNRYVNPEVRALMEEYNAIRYKNIHSPSIEERKAFVCSKIGKTFSELNEITYREFNLIYDASVNSEIYIGQKIIQGSYKYEVKEEVLHPLFQKKEDPYASLFEDTSKLSGKGISGAEQLNAMNLQN